MSQSVDVYSSLVAAIYDCATDATLWPKVLSRICEAMGAADIVICKTALDGSEVRYVTPLGVPALPGPFVSPAPIIETSAHLQRLAATAAFDMNEPVSLGTDIQPSSSFTTKTSPPSLIAVMQSTKHRVVTLIVTRSTDADNHLRIDVSLRQLIPHIRRALQICELLDEQKLAKHTLRASLDLLAPAVIIVDEHARLIDCNATANIMLQRQSGLRLSDNRVVPVLTGLEGTFAYAIARACVARPGEALPGSAVTLSGSDSHAIVAHIMPVATHATSPNQENNRSAAAIFIGGASLTAPAALDAVAATYRLTEGELRVLTQVANGESIAEAAAKLGITLATTRTHLKRIFAKLGVSRQAELVGLLNRIAPLRRQVPREMPGPTRSSERV